MSEKCQERKSPRYSITSLRQARKPIPANPISSIAQAGASVLRRDPFGGNTQLRVFGAQKQFPATAYHFATTENATICAV
jgi:hypothetical protein